MNFWARFAINTALSAVRSLLGKPSITSDHRDMLEAFIQSGQDLLNNW